MVRRALSMALDRGLINNSILTGLGKPIYTHGGFRAGTLLTGRIVGSLSTTLKAPKRCSQKRVIPTASRWASGSRRTARLSTPKSV